MQETVDATLNRTVSSGVARTLCVCVYVCLRACVCVCVCGDCSVGGCYPVSKCCPTAVLQHTPRCTMDTHLQSAHLMQAGISGASCYEVHFASANRPTYTHTHHV